MTYGNVLIAHGALGNLTAKRFTSFRVARQLVALRKKVDEEFDFYVSEEKKLLDLYALKNEDGGPKITKENRIQLKDEESAKAFLQKISELRNSPVEGIEPVKLCEGDFCEAQALPTPDEMIALEGFVEFE